MGVAKDEFSPRPRPSSVDSVKTPKPPRDPRDDMMEDFKNDLGQIRKCVTCNVCQELLFEPYSLECGHIYCYGCLTDWFGQKKTCPDCRAPVIQKPAPTYLIRDIVETFVSREELTNPHGTGAELRKTQKEALTRLECDKHTLDGLFKGLFTKRRKKRLLRGIRDPSDHTLRCPDCMWEVLDGRCVTCDRPVLDDHAPQGYSDMSEDDEMDSYDEESYLEEDIGRGTNRRMQPRQFIDLTSPGPGRGTRDFPLEVVDEEDSESEDEDDTSMQDFIDDDGLSSPPRIRGANNRRPQRESSIVSMDTSLSTNATVSSPVTQNHRNRRRRVIDDSDDEEEEEEDEEPVSIQQRRAAARRNVIPSTSEAEEGDSSEATGGASFGNGRYPQASSDNESDQEYLLNSSYQPLDDDTGGDEGESDAPPFSPVATNSSQATSSSTGNGRSSRNRDRSTPTNNHLSFQSSSPAVRQANNRPYRNTRRRIIEDDEDEEDEWDDASSEEDSHDREGDINMNRLQQGSSISRPSTVQRVRNRRGLMSPAIAQRQRRSIPPSQSSHDSDGDTTDTLSNSGRDNRRTVRTDRGAETTFFSNHRQPNRPLSRNQRQRLELANGGATQVDPNIQALFSNFRQQQEARQQNRMPSHDLADLGLSAARSTSPSRSITPMRATDREATPTNASTHSTSSQQSSQNSFNPASMMSAGLGQQRPTNSGLMAPSQQLTPGRANNRQQPMHASFSPQLSSAPPRTAPSPGPALHFRSPLARIHRAGSRNGMRSPGSRNGMRQSTASPMGSNVGYGSGMIGNNNPWNPRLLRSSMSPTAAPPPSNNHNLLSSGEQRPPMGHRYQSAPAEIPSSPPNFMQRHTSDSIYQLGANLMQQRESMQQRDRQIRANSESNFGSSPPSAQPQSRLLSNTNPTGLGLGQRQTIPNSQSSQQSSSPQSFPYQSFGQALGQQPLSPPRYGVGLGEEQNQQRNPMYVVGREST